MKRFKFYSMLIATAAVTFLASCGGDDDEVKPDPAVNIKTSTGYTSGTAEVSVDSVVKAGIIINHDRKIKNVKFEVTTKAGSRFTVVDSTVNDKVIDIDFTRRVPPTPTTETWTITATDADGKTGSVSISLTVNGADQVLQSFDPVPPQKGVQIYNIKDPSPSNTSAFDLNTKTPSSASSTTDDKLKDIIDANTSTTDYMPQWTSKTGATFLKVTSSSFTYANTLNYSQLVDYYEANAAGVVSTTAVIAANDLYIVKAGDNGQYYLMSIINVEDVASMPDGDHVEFKYKTLP